MGLCRGQRLPGRDPSLLCHHFQAELITVDIESLRPLTYGEGRRYTRRAYLIYDGSHFDPLTCAAGADAPESSGQCNCTLVG